MADTISILLQHGWAFDKSIWQDWISSNDHDYNFILPDRGYYGNPEIVDYSKVTVAVTHSFGLHLLPDNLFSQLDRLVIISGFHEFHPSTRKARLMSQRAVVQMISKLEVQSEEVLQKFYLNCFAPEKPRYHASKMPDIKLLHKDLQRLNNHVQESEKLIQPGKVYILHGSNDRIVNTHKATELEKMIPGSTLAIKHRAGHMLPVSHTQWCLDQLKTLF